MNLYQLFRQLTPPAPVEIMTISQTGYSDGTSQATTVAGTTVVVLGQQYEPGTRVFVQNNRVIGEAPDLPVVQIEV